MKVSDYIVEYLIEKNVTDVFGIPGGVVLELLYACKRHEPEIQAHLCYHEQGAAFAACGYAQASGRIGVAYATRGPGIANMMTGIADAYYDSVPVMFFTAHEHVDVDKNQQNMRIAFDQELDAVDIFSKVTKYAAKVECIEDVAYELDKAYTLAMSGRKGPVLLDFSAKLFEKEIEVRKYHAESVCDEDSSRVVERIREVLASSRRPVFLIGDGIHQCNTQSIMKQIAEKSRIPVLSSRFAQDIMPDSPMYFGYIGSHALRYSNFILAKTDCIIAIGNRMAFPVESKSFRPIVEKAKIVRIEIDKEEFHREIPDSINYCVDLKNVLLKMQEEAFGYQNKEEWLTVCNILKTELWNYDTGKPVCEIQSILEVAAADYVITSDVGNNEFWLSRAYALSGRRNRILYSKSFGALGCSLPKAIGAYYATKKPVICFAGDQGLQLNIQELQFLKSNHLPVIIVLINNESSGMIKCRQKNKYHGSYVHTTKESGYSVPDFYAIAMAYGMNYVFYADLDREEKKVFANIHAPGILELKVDASINLEPNLPAGNKCQALVPEIPNELYEQLEQL